MQYYSAIKGVNFSHTIQHKWIRNTTLSEKTPEYHKLMILFIYGQIKPKKKKKSRDITLPTKVCLVKAMVFPVAMYGCESWTVKKAEH